MRYSTAATTSREITLHAALEERLPVERRTVTDLESLEDGESGARSGFAKSELAHLLAPDWTVEIDTTSLSLRHRDGRSATTTIAPNAYHSNRSGGAMEVLAAVNGSLIELGAATRVFAYWSSELGQQSGLFVATEAWVEPYFDELAMRHENGPTDQLRYFLPSGNRIVPRM